MKRHGQCSIGGVESRQQKKHLKLLLHSSWQRDLLKEDLDLKGRLEQEFLLTLLALLTVDLGFRFHVSATTVSSIFVTWIKLMSKELSVLIVWPSRQQVKKTLPFCFRKLYPKVRCIIDCFECFVETPSGLDLAATLWSEYKHHYTFKVLVAITPNGAISYVSSCYGGRAFDIFHS